MGSLHEIQSQFLSFSLSLRFRKLISLSTEQHGNHGSDHLCEFFTSHLLPRKEGERAYTASCVQCTSTTSSFNYYYVPNATAGGINQFPTVQDDATILGQNAADADSRIFILGSSATGVYWIHVVAAILAVLCVLSLVVPPSWLGSEESRLFAFQKSGVVTILLALSACVLSFVTFIAEIAVAIPARNRLNSINGISGQLVRLSLSLSLD